MRPRFHSRPLAATPTKIEPRDNLFILLGLHAVWVAITAIAALGVWWVVLIFQRYIASDKSFRESWRFFLSLPVAGGMTLYALFWQLALTWILLRLCGKTLLGIPFDFHGDGARQRQQAHPVQTPSG